MHHRRPARFIAVALLAVLAATRAWAGPPHPDLPDPTFDFETFFVTWTGNGEPWVLPYVKDARPAIVQIGMFGPMMHAYADTADAMGYPMQLPARGQMAVVRRQREQISSIRLTGAKVVTHFQITNIIDANTKTEESGLWHSFIENRWDPELLGLQPSTDPLDYLMVDEAGNPLTQSHYHLTYVGLCMNKPAAREFLIRALDVALDCGVDGILTNYNYYWGCACPYCQASFRDYLRERRLDLPALGITHPLETHPFGRIPASLPGYPPADAGDLPLRLEAQRWAAIRFKALYDAVLITHGRDRQRDLILASWNHLGDLGITEERAFLPIELWGRGENYFWYSGGYGPPDYPAGKLGDGWLQSLYIRELSGAKPFMMGKYEQIRMRNSLAESLATGGAGMGLYMRVEDPVARDVALQYTRFAREQQAYFRGATPYADVALLLPRQALLAGQRDAMTAFKTAGQALLAEHRLVDLIADEKLTPQRLAGLSLLVAPQPQRLTDAQIGMLEAFVQAGGRVIDTWPPPAPDAPAGDPAPTEPAAPADAPAAPADMTAALSHVDAPSTVRVAAWQQPERLQLHLVNYKLRPTGHKPRGPADEIPEPVPDIAVDLRLPAGKFVRAVQLFTPDADVVFLDFQQDSDRVRYRIPELRAYALITMTYGPEPDPTPAATP